LQSALSRAPNVSEVALVTEAAGFQLLAFDQSILVPWPTHAYGAAAAEPAAAVSAIPATSSNAAAALRRR
jgi:hypothetical protein